MDSTSSWDKDTSGVDVNAWLSALPRTPSTPGSILTGFAIPMQHPKLVVQSCITLTQECMKKNFKLLIESYRPILNYHRCLAPTSVCFLPASPLMSLSLPHIRLQRTDSMTTRDYYSVYGSRRMLDKVIEHLPWNHFNYHPTP